MRLSFKIRGSHLNKILDRYVGIPALLLLTLWNRLIFRKLASHANKSVFCIQIGTIGDAVLTLPALNGLKKAGFEISILTNPSNDEIYRLNGFETVCIHLADLTKPRKFLELIRSLRKRRYSFVIDFLQWSRISAFLAGLLKSRENMLVGFDTQNQFRGFIFDRTALHSSSVHESENYFRLISLVDSKIQESFTPRVLFEEKIERALHEANLDRRLGFAFRNEPYIVVHPWSGGFKGQNKEWPLENYLTLVNLLPPQFRIVITGSNAEISRADLFSQVPRATSLVGKTNLVETAGVLFHSRLVITVNTGILHLAAWLGKDIVCLNGPTNAKRWGGLRTKEEQKIINLNANTSCSPCLNLGFEYKCTKMFCMPTISVAAVRNAVDQIISVKEDLERHPRIKSKPSFYGDRGDSGLIQPVY